MARGGRGRRGRATPGAVLGAAVLGSALLLRGAAGIVLEGDDEDESDLFAEPKLKPFDETRKPEIAQIFNEGDCDLGTVKENDAVTAHVQLAWSAGIIMDTFGDLESPITIDVGEKGVLKGVNWALMK